MVAFLVAMLLAIVPQESVVVESVDVIEVNHLYDGCGDLVFTQVIFWDFDWRLCRLQVCAWRMVKHDSQLPRFQRRIDHGLEDAFTLWKDGEVVREVRAKAVRETWTQYDPELLERELLPPEARRGLRPSGPATAATATAGDGDGAGDGPGE